MRFPAWLMMTGLFLTFFGMSLAAAKEGYVFKSYPIEGKSVKFIDDAKRRMEITFSCLQDGKYRCQAYEALMRVPTLRITGQSLAGRNPGAVICVDYLHARYLISTDAKGNERGFCAFEDGSMISPGSLYRVANETD